MSRYFYDFYTATLNIAKRHSTMRSDTRQREAILDNAKRHSTMRSDIWNNIVSHCRASTGAWSEFTNSPTNGAIMEGVALNC